MMKGKTIALTDYVNRIRERDRKTISAIYQDSISSIERWVGTNSGNTQDAKDLLQEAFMVLYDNCQSNDFKLTCLPTTYLFAVARNKWLKRLKKKGKELAIEGEIADVPLEEDLSSHQQRELQFQTMENQISSLGTPCSGLIQAFYFKQQTLFEIQQDFGYSTVQSAKNQKYKCLQRLKRLFFQHHSSTVLTDTNE